MDPGLVGVRGGSGRRGGGQEVVATREGTDTWSQGPKVRRTVFPHHHHQPLPVYFRSKASSQAELCFCNWNQWLFCYRDILNFGRVLLLQETYHSNTRVLYSLMNSIHAVQERFLSVKVPPCRTSVGVRAKWRHYPWPAGGAVSQAISQSAAVSLCVCASRWWLAGRDYTAARLSLSEYETHVWIKVRFKGPLSYH